MVVAVWSSIELKYSRAPPSSLHRLAIGMAKSPKIPVSEALRWLVDQGVKLVGIDTPGLEVQGNPALINETLKQRLAG